MSTKSLLKSTGIISFGTALSRILGFVRDIMIANFFGTGGAIQAFFIAFKIPNLLRHFVAEGATNSVFVPVLSEYRVKKSNKEFLHLANVLLNALLIALAIFVVLGSAGAPLIVRAIAPGFIADQGKLQLAIDLLRMLFPYIFLIGLASYFMGILNSLKHFTVPAFSPILLNVSIIAAMLIFRDKIDVAILAAAILVGGALQLIAQLPVLYKKGIKLKIPYTLRHPAAKNVMRLLIPRLMGATVYQLNVFVDTILASLHWIVGAGGIAALYYSNRLIQLPTAVFGIAIATAALPILSGHFSKSDMNKFKETLNFSLKSLFIVMIPATVGFIVLGDKIIRILFERGEFTAYSTMITSQALIFYSIGLFSYAGIKILVFCFYSMQDTVTPVKTASLSLAINLIFNLILMWPLKLAGLALATSIAGLCNFFLLLHLLKKRIGPFGESHMTGFLSKIILSSVVMGLILFIVPAKIGDFFARKGIFFDAAYLFLSIVAAVIVYFGMLHILRVRELGKFTAWVLRRR